MAYYEDDEIHEAYQAATKEADQWRDNYDEYERLADNGLLEALDENLPEVNDGSLAASLFKLPKRVVNSKLTGRARATDRDEAWLTELANIRWEKNIIPRARSMAPFHRKIKDVVRKAAIYGGQPVVELFIEDHTDMLVPPAADIKLEAGKVSDYDSDIIFWDLYYTRKYVEGMKEEAAEEMKEADHELKRWKQRQAAAQASGQKFDEDEPEPYNRWFTEILDEILSGNAEEDKPGNEEQRQRQENGIKKSGFHFYIAFQRGKSAPFSMHYGKRCVREWSNPDPTGDIPVHYLYCYQDFINPYGIGIVKLAGGTQNVLDYMRKADILATQIGIRPPKQISGDTTDLDMDSLTWTEDADWIVGDAKVEPMEMANGVYQQLPGRMQQYKQSLNQILPMGDTSISAGNGDPLASKTPAGVKASVQSLSIDDEDFRDNLYMWYEAVAKSMINTEFANMMGNDTMKVTDEERDILSQAGIDFTDNVTGELTNELDIEWDLARAEFEFEVDAENDKAKDDAQKLEGLRAAADFLSNPNTQLLLAKPEIVLGNKKINIGELVAEMIALSTDNDKIVTDISPEEVQQRATAAQETQPEDAPAKLTPEEMQLKQRELDIKQQGNDHKLLDLKLKGQDQAHRQALEEHKFDQSERQQSHSQEQDKQNAALPTATHGKGKKPTSKKAALPGDQKPAVPNQDEQHMRNVQAVMEQFNIPEDMAEMMINEEEKGTPVEEILAGLERFKQSQAAGGGEQ